MSERYFGDNRRRGPTAFGAAGRRTAFGYWVPLALTVTVAAVGLAAWVWSERNEDDDDYNNGGGQEGRTPIGMDPGMEDSGYTKATSADGQERMPDEDHSMMSRVQDAWRRTPSPQQFFDGASKKVAAGVAAAGAAVGGALGAIREERPGDFEDHSRWAEEPDASAANAPRARSGVRAAPPATSSKTEPKVNKKKTVAIVISSVSGDETDHDTISEHAVSSNSPC